MEKNIFENYKKDLTQPTHYTLKKSIINKIKKDALENNISESKVVNAILEKYYKSKK